MAWKFTDKQRDAIVAARRGDGHPRLTAAEVVQAAANGELAGLDPFAISERTVQRIVGQFYETDGQPPTQAKPDDELRAIAERALAHVATIEPGKLTETWLKSAAKATEILRDLDAQVPANIEAAAQAEETFVNRVVDIMVPAVHEMLADHQDDPDPHLALEGRLEAKFDTLADELRAELIRPTPAPEPVERNGDDAEPDAEGESAEARADRIRAEIMAVAAEAQARSSARGDLAAVAPPARTEPDEPAPRRQAPRRPSNGWGD
jgi:hypothetical protein